MGRLVQSNLYFFILFLITAPVSAFPLPVPDGYISVEAGPCRVAVPEQNTGIAHDLLSVCEKKYKHIFRQLGLNRNREIGSVDVRVAGSPEEMKSVAPPGAEPPSWSGAVAYPDVNLVILSLTNQMGSPVRDLDIVLEHELSHLALREALKGADVPRWFSEGLAIQQSEKSSFRRYWILWLAARGDNLLPLSTINRYPDQPGQINLAYAEAVDFIGFLLRRDGWLGLRVVIRERAQGVPFEKAFELSYRDSLPNLEDEWRAGLMSRWQWLPLVTGTGAVWGFIVALFFIAYAAAKRRKKKRLAEMEEEEYRLERHVDQEMKMPAKKPRIAELPDISTNIRVDDEIHTLH